MTEPALSGPLEGLEILERGHLSRYKAAIAVGRQTGWGYYFPYLLSCNAPGRSAMLLAEDEGSICVFRWRVRGGLPRLDVYLPPAPMHAGVLQRCIERANEFNGDLSARVMRIDEADADAVASAGLRVRPSKMQYVYEPGAYDDLAGKRFTTLRRSVARVERLPDVQVLPYSTSHAGACHALLAEWKAAHRDAHGTAGGAGTSRRALELAGVLPEQDLRGEVVLVDGRLAAFALGGEIRPGLACSFERKCDTSVQGLSYFHLRSFLRSLREFERVNDGSDTGRAGLRQIKEMFRPVAMHAEHRARQRRPGGRRG